MGEYEKIIDMHKKATEACDRWFWSFFVPSDGYKLIHRNGTDYHFCGSEKVLKEKFKECNGTSLDHINGLAGWGGIDGQVWTVAHFTKKGKIIPNQWTLGHEDTHQLDDDPAIDSPDKARTKEYYEG